MPQHTTKPDIQSIRFWISLTCAQLVYAILEEWILPLTSTKRSRTFHAWLLTARSALIKLVGTAYCNKMLDIMAQQLIQVDGIQST